jgi:alkylhydroperoxidase family enzyme
MARLRYLDKADLKPEDQDILERPINLNRILAHSPDCRRAALGLVNYIRYDSRLDPRLREIAILAVGYLAKAPYEWSHHVKLGHEFGVTDGDIDALIALCNGQSADMDEAASAVVSAVREMMLKGAASQEALAGLRAHVDDACLIDLLMAVGYYIGIVRVLATLAVDVEPEYAPYLEKYPLPE